MGLGVSGCAVCDGFFYRQKVVAVVGGGDTAAEEALYLSKLCSYVHLLVRSHEMKASRIMQDRITSTSNITVHWNSQTLEILGDQYVNGARVVDVTNNSEKIITLDGFFVAIGHQPNTQLFKNQLELDDYGYIITQPRSTYTNIPGVFAAGDVQDAIYRQAVTAAGSGCMAALDSERWLEGQGI